MPRAAAQGSQSLRPPDRGPARQSRVAGLTQHRGIEACGRRRDGRARGHDRRAQAAQPEAGARVRQRRRSSRSSPTCWCVRLPTAAGSSSSTTTRCRACWSTAATSRACRAPPGPSQDKEYLVDCLQSANWLVKSLDQRARTILRVAEEIVRQQDGFFAHGVQHLRPLNLKTVADAIKMHESTVSRVTSNKYIATPRGIFELKYFFTSSIAAVGRGRGALLGSRAAPDQAADRRRNRRRACCPTTKSSRSSSATASTSPAARSRSTARRCAYRPRSSAAARSA